MIASSEYSFEKPVRQFYFWTILAESASTIARSVALQSSIYLENWLAMGTRTKRQNHQNHSVGQLVFARLWHCPSASSLNQAQGPPFATLATPWEDLWTVIRICSGCSALSSLPISLKFMSGSSCSDLPSLKGYIKATTTSDLKIQKRFVLVPRPWNVVNEKLPLWSFFR